MLKTINKVYVVEGNVDYEYSEVLAIFAKREDAETLAEKYRQGFYDIYFDNVFVYEEEVR